MKLPLPAFTDSLPAEYTETGSGGVSAGGTGPEEFNVEVGSGGVSAGGEAAVEYWPYEHDMTGGVSASSGDAADTLEVVEAGSGGATAGGTGPEEFNVEVGSGGVSTSGTASVVMVIPYIHNVTGGISAGGAAEIADTFPIIGEGGSTVAGDAGVVDVYVSVGALAANLPSPMYTNGVLYTNNIVVGAFFPYTLRASLTGITGESGDMAAALPLLTTECHAAPNLDLTLYPLTGAMDAYVGVTAELAAALRPLQATSWDATAPFVGDVDADLLVLTSQFSGLTGLSSTLVAIVPKLTTQLTGMAGAAGSMAGRLYLPTGALAGEGGVAATLQTTLPRLTGAFTQPTGLTYLQTYVVNMSNSMMTSFSNYGFTSVAAFDGEVYATGTDGIYRLDGATDNGAPIDAYIELGNHDLGNRNLKRVADFYMAYHTDGKIKLTVSTDETKAYSYQMLPYNVTTIKQRRVALGKGMRGKYWKIIIENVEGSDLRLESLHLRVATQARRV